MLIDSHVLLWLLADDDRLGAAARTRLTRAARVHVSAITFLELTIKAMLGRVSTPERFAELVAQQGLHHAPFTAEDAEAVRLLPGLDRHDPFDRSLLAQAQRQGWDFMTADARLLALGLAGTVDARL
ncbi:type II toxin-antitoxin system VapC family toxin [Litorihabitans aurantiacus]|uniref:PIN domain-containing protein n=1 Tax=Litorihabitans aurantiacus TaxID=1930061 RepID=A0AA37XI83_9MICO|nr:type II toxin-antitoxin system VapC family toxin [Litorihabitans aurantiacus]GMA33035.1 hypothetical protein GCM10025875_30270 [Litorihabitans aurantiacus]